MSHYEEGSTICHGTCQLLSRSHSIVCGDRSTVEWSVEERITGACAMGWTTGEGFCDSTRASVVQASTGVTRSRLAIRSPHGRFELWTGSCLDARVQWEVISRGVWQQEIDICREEILHHGKKVLSHRMECVEISTLLGGQTIYLTDYISRIMIDPDES